MGKALRRAIPWVITSALLFWLFYRTDLDAVWAALSGANLALLLPLWTLAILTVFFVDTGCLVFLFRRLGQAVPVRELFAVKGASYLLNVINYNAASAGIGYLVSRKTGAPLLEALSSMLMLSGLDVLALTLFVGIGYLGNPDFLIPEFEGPVLFVSALVILGYVGMTLVWALRSKIPFVQRASEWQLFYCMRASTLRDQLLLVGMRFGFMWIYFLTQYVSLESFSISIPLPELVAFNAILTLVGIVPISIAGLGTTQFAMVALYTPYALAAYPGPGEAEAVILAYSTAIIFYFVLVRLGVGYFFFNRLTRDLRDGFGVGGQSLEGESST